MQDFIQLCDSKNYYGFVVDEFGKLVHTIKSRHIGFYPTAGHGLK